MKGSRLEGPDAWVVATATVDLSGRLGVPASLFALALSAHDAALASALAVALLAPLRGLLAGRLTRVSMDRVLEALVAAGNRYGVVALRGRTPDKGAAVLLEAAYLVAGTRAHALPRLYADAVGLALVAVAASWRLGLAWVLLGGVVLAVSGGLAGLGLRRARRIEQRAWDRSPELWRDFSAQLEACAELRAHGCEARLAAAVRATGAVIARERGRAETLSALFGLLPLGLALLAVTAPVREGVGWLAAGTAAMRVAETGVLGATALGLGIGLARTLEQLARAAPRRDLLRDFVTSAPSPPAPTTAPAGARSPLAEDVVLDDVSMVYPGASHATPAPVRHRWSKGGLAVVGDNGAGKSTLALALLGLVAPTRGAIRFGASAADDATFSAVRARAVYLPQQAFLWPSASIGWHLRLVAPEGTSDDALAAALEEVELWPLLEARARARGVGALELPAGELSGGEQRRMHLARALLRAEDGSAELVVLDEPEAGLDQAGRVLLRSWLERLACRSRVLLVAHDSSIVPEAFVRLRCERGPAATGGAHESAA
jgi:ABC-type transport system involved in cytochrome bd biosynthesis fused ATPase/permease subunit